MSGVGNVHQNQKVCFHREDGPPFLHSSCMTPGQGCTGMTRVQPLVGIWHIAQVQAKRRLVQGSQLKQEEASGGDALGRQGLESRRSDR